MRHRFGIRKKIMLTMALMTIIPVLVMGIVSTAQSRNIIKEQTNTLARKNLIITAQEINEKVNCLWRFEYQNNGYYAIRQDSSGYYVTSTNGAAKLGVKASGGFTNHLTRPDSPVLSGAGTVLLCAPFCVRF